MVPSYVNSRFTKGSSSVVALPNCSRECSWTFVALAMISHVCLSSQEWVHHQRYSQVHCNLEYTKISLGLWINLYANKETTHTNTSLMVHRYTKSTLPVDVRGGTKVSVGPVDQKSHHRLQQATSTLYNGVTPYLCVSSLLCNLDYLKIFSWSTHMYIYNK